MYLHIFNQNEPLTFFLTYENVMGSGNILLMETLNQLYVEATFKKRKIIPGILYKILENSWNFVSAEKWEPCQGMTSYMEGWSMQLGNSF